MTDRVLAELTRLLTKRAMTAAEVAKATGCGKPTAYRRIRALKASGARVEVERVKKPASGPGAAAYRVIKGGG